MGGATIQCADFEGNDKAVSPIVSVLDQAFLRAFGFKRRGRLARRLGKFFGSRTSAEREEVERTTLEVMYDEEGEITSSVAECLLPHLRSYQHLLLRQLNIPNTVEAIWPHMSASIAAKYVRPRGHTRSNTMRCRIGRPTSCPSNCQGNWGPRPTNFM